MDEINVYDGGLNEKILSKILYTLLILCMWIFLPLVVADFGDGFVAFVFLFLGLIAVPLLFYKWRADQNKKCAWCSSKTGLKFVDGRLSNSGVWRHQNRDGSADKRFSTNFQYGYFYSKYHCKKCNAETEFMHRAGVHSIMLENGSYERFGKISKRNLVNNGGGNRNGTDWERESKPSWAHRMIDFLTGR